jgi:hypothetical protein
MSLFNGHNFPISVKPLEDNEVEKIKLEIANSSNIVKQKRNRNNSHCMINYDYEYKTIQVNKSNTKFSSQRSASGKTFFISNLKNKKSEKIDKITKIEKNQGDYIKKNKFSYNKNFDFSDPNSVNQSLAKIKYTPIKYQRINSSTLDETPLTQSQSRLQIPNFLNKDLPKIYFHENINSEKKESCNSTLVSPLLEKRRSLNSSIFTNLKSTSDKFFEELKTKQKAEKKEIRDLKKQIKGKLSKLINTSLIYSASQDPENRKKDREIKSEKSTPNRVFLPIKKIIKNQNKSKENKLDRGRARRFEDFFMTQEELIFNNFSNKEIEIIKHQPDYSKIKNKYLKDVNIFKNKSLLELLTEEEKGFNALNQRKEVVKNSKSPFNV